MQNLKSQKLISLLLSISILMSIFAVSGISASAAVSGDFTYSVVNGDSALITGYSGNEKNLVIPDSLNGYTVKGVDANTFFHCKNLESVTFPASVTSISESVFQGYPQIKEIIVNSANKNYSSKDGVLFNKSQNNLIIYPRYNENTSYEIPGTVKTISPNAFYGSENLTELVIPNGVSEIGYYAFDSCTSLEKLTIPASVSKIGDNAFYRCLSLTGFDVDSANKAFLSEDGVLFNKAKTELISYPSAADNTAYSVPNSVTSVCKAAFRDAVNLTEVTIPNGVKTIGTEAFKGCTSLENIEIPSSVSVIDTAAFHGCTSLKTAVLPPSLSKISDNLFYNCSSLADIVIPNTVTSIGSYSFYGCTALTEINIPENVTSAGKSAFSGCKNIADVYYGGSKTSWNNISVSSGNEYLLNADVHFSKLHFVDLNGFDNYIDYVKYTSLYNDFITGTNPPARTHFSPNNTVTRAMFVTILYRMAGSPYDNGKNPHSRTPFTDITDKSAYYYNAACWALDKGVTTEKTFKPYNNVSREQTAVFLFRYAQNSGLIENDDYKSVSLRTYKDYRNISTWAYEAMQWANYNGMITGTLQGFANPQNATYRIHASKILYGFGVNCNIGNFN